MAITNAQQYQQLVNKRADGKRPGYRGPGGYQGGRSDTPAGAAQAGSVDRGGGNTNRERAITQQYKGPKGTTGDIRGSGADPKPPTEIIAGKEFPVNPRTPEEQEQKNFAISIENDRKRTAARKEKLKEIAFLENLGKLGYTRRTKDSNLVDLGVIDAQTPTIGGYAVPSFYTGVPAAFTVDPATDYFDIDSPREIASTLTTTSKGITGTQAATLGDLRQDIQMEDRLNDPTDTVTQSEFEEYMNRNKVTLPEGGGRDDQYYIPPVVSPVVEPEEEIDPNSLQGLLANRIAYRFMADGGRAGFMGGGMPDDFIGGLADGNLDEMGRQMYGLGKLVKKATRAVKKIVKSPVGKAALLYAGTGGLGNLAAGKGFGSMFSNFLSPSKFLSTVPGIFTKGGLQNIASRIGLGSFKNTGSQRLFEANKLGSLLGSPLGMITAASALSGLMTKSEEDENENEEETYYRGPGLDIEAIRRDPYGNKRSAYRFYADGGDVKEPVAKDTMPLLDMNGMEKDYRADGGFVPIGRMERADDVPARLSKNEFVFTADAVRNAGDGDVDKGAEVMYNMMKNLESGGKVSEESQGLDGARDMFQTSKRLEEVL